MEIKLTHHQRELVFYVYRRKRQKRIIFHALENDMFKVTTPYRISRKVIEQSIIEHLDALDKLKPRLKLKEHLLEAKEIPVFGEVVKMNQLSNANKPYESLKEMFIEAIHKMVAQFNQLDRTLDLESVQFSVRYMTSKFGSCQPHKRRVSLNLELIHYPKVFLEYIFAHEIAHLKHPNHSDRFYDYLDQIMPHHKTLKKSLNNWHTRLISEGFDALINVTNSDKSSII